MGLQGELGLSARRPNLVQRVMQAFAASRFGSWLFAKVLHHVDRILFRVTRGRLTVPTIAGLPALLVSVPGARSGRMRQVPLLGIPFGDDLALIGSNWGGPCTPAWVHNLAAAGRATVAHRDRVVPVEARPADREETERVFESAAGVYPGYVRYRSRVDREIRVFVLQPDRE